MINDAQSSIDPLTCTFTDFQRRPVTLRTLSHGGNAGSNPVGGTNAETKGPVLGPGPSSLSVPGRPGRLRPHPAVDESDRRSARRYLEHFVVRGAVSVFRWCGAGATDRLAS